MAKKGKSGGFSPLPEAMTEGGGINGAIGVISEVSAIEEFTYGGAHRDKPTAALHLEYTCEGFKQPWKEDFTLGPSKGWEAVDEGYGFKALAEQDGFNKKSGIAPFIVALVAACKEAEIDLDDVMSYDSDERTVTFRGLEGRTVRLKQVEYETQGGDKKEKTVIAAFVEDEAPAKGKKATNGSGKKGSKSVDEKTADAILALLEETPKIKLSDLPNEVFDANKKDPDAKAMMQRAMKESFVAGVSGVALDKKKGVITAVEP